MVAFDIRIIRINSKRSIYRIELDGQMSLDDLKRIVEKRTSIYDKYQTILHNGKLIPTGRLLTIEPDDKVQVLVHHVQDQCQLSSSKQHSIFKIWGKFVRLFQLARGARRAEDPKSQTILLNDELVDTERFLTIKRGDKIEVEHSMLKIWDKFMRLFQLAQEARSADDYASELQNALLAQEQLTILSNSNFFYTFHHLLSFRGDFRNKYSCFGESEFQYILTAWNHFCSTRNVNYPDSVQFRFESFQNRRRGIRDGLRILERQSGVLIKTYDIKVHTRFAEKHGEGSADLRVLFMHKLMEILGIGPKVHFLSCTDHSGFGLYIAAEDLSSCVVDESSVSREGKDRVKIVSLCCFLRDIAKKANYGVDSQGNFIILDFEIREQTSYMFNSFLHLVGAESRNMAKKFLENLDIANSIDKAKIEIEEQRKLLEEHGITQRAEHDFDEYLAKIEDNFQRLTSFSNE